MPVNYTLSRKKIYILFFVLDIITSIERLLLFPDMGVIFHVSLFFGTFAVIAITWEFLLFISKRLEKKMPIAHQPIQRIITQILLCFLLICILGYSLFNYAEIYFNIATPDILRKIIPVLYLFTSMIINLIYFGVYYFREWKENLVRNERLQKEQTQVKYDALRNQLNPHFLFNALTSLNSLIFENQQLASDFLQQLSKVYRYTLQNKDKETVSLATEMDFINNYIFLFKTRFENAIHFKIDIDKDLRDKGIVPVTIQVLIENAVKHNIVTEKSPLIISILAKGNFINVENTINKKSQIETSNGQGLENLKVLYQYLSETEVEITETDSIFKVKIPLI